MPYRLRILAKIVKGFAEAEVHVDARRHVELRPFDKSTHAINQRAIGFCHPFHRGQLLEGDRLALDCLGQVARGLLKHSPRREKLRKQLPRRRDLPGRPERGGRAKQALEFLLRFIRLAL